MPSTDAIDLCEQLLAIICHLNIFLLAPDVQNQPELFL